MISSSRRTFLLGSVSTIALTGCGGARSALLPGASPKSGTSSVESIGVVYLRNRHFRSIQHFDSALRAKSPAGSSVYYSGAYLVEDGTRAATFPQSSTLTRDASSLRVYNDVAKTTTAFTSAATVTVLADSVAWIVAANQPVDPYLRSQIAGGHAFLAGRIGISQSTTRRASDFEDEDDTDDGGDGYDVAWTGNNEITSSNNQCLSGGENVGVSYTVPSGYSSNVTVTICVDNGTGGGGNVCAAFTNQVPGSSHNVSVWVTGSGPPGISMGIVTKSGTQNGVGWSSLGGC